MKKYDTFLFDLDDTLLNFKASEKLSFKKTMESINQTSMFEDLFDYYKRENKKLWDSFDRGEVSKDLLKVKRFQLLFDQFNIKSDPHEVSEYYLNSLPETVVLLKDALTLLEKLKSFAQVGIITNGIEYIQKRRLAVSGIDKLVDFICVSEACGYAKPDIRFFEYTALNIKDFSKKTTLIIGDRYEADILGGYNFGIDTCWYNHEGFSKDKPIHTFEINNLNELLKLLNLNEA